MGYVENMEISSADNATFAPAILRAIPFQPDDLPCTSLQHYWLYSLVFSVSVIVVLVILERRNHPHRCGRYPGIIYPVDLVNYKTDNIGYAAAFGSMTSHCWNLFWDSNSGFMLVPAWAKSLVAMAQVLYIGLQFYPLFVCLQTPCVIIGSTFGLVFSAYWFWLYLAAVIKCPTSADDSSSLTGENIAVMLPVLVCLLVLMLRFIGRLAAHVIVLVRNRITPFQLRRQEEEQERIALPCNIEYVKQLLTPSFHEPVIEYGQIEEPTFINKTRALLSRWLYLNDPTFKYSPRVVAILTVGVICSYQFGIVIVLLTYQLQQLLPELENYGNNTNGTDDNNLFDMGLVIQVFNNSSIISFILSSCLTLFSMSQILSNYRQNLRRMFKGDYNRLPFKRDKRGKQFILSDSLCYAGSQIAYILWGYVISYSVMVLTCMLVAYAVILPLFNITSRQYLSYIGNLVSGMIIFQLLYLVQKLFCRIMLHRRNASNDDGTATTEAVLAIDNRKVYHNLSFFLFFLYIILGLYGCFVTMIKSIVLWIFFLGRMDKCGLIQGFESFDTGYMYYTSFLYVEESHRHPVVIVFCDILNYNMKCKALGLHSYPPRVPCLSQTERSTSVTEEYHRAKKRWLKAYTLLRNPSLKPPEPDQDFVKLESLHVEV